MKSLLPIASAFMLAGVADFGHALAQQSTQPNLSGTYRCAPDPKVCEWSGQTFTVAQQGNILNVKNDKGSVGDVKVTSDVSLSAGPPWNMLGVILPGNRSIQWSNGTVWRRT